MIARVDVRLDSPFSGIVFAKIIFSRPGWARPFTTQCCRGAPGNDHHLVTATQNGTGESLGQSRPICATIPAQRRRPRPGTARSATGHTLKTREDTAAARQELAGPAGMPAPVIDDRADRAPPGDNGADQEAVARVNAARVRLFGRINPSLIEAGKLGERLRDLREKRGRSRQAVAKALGLPRTVVADMESGARSVSDPEIRKLAEFYGCPFSSFFYPERELRKEEVFLAVSRACPELKPTRKIGADMRRVLDFLEIGMCLRRFLGRVPGPAVPDYAAQVENAGAAIRQGETVAREERRRLGLGHGPLPDIAELIVSQGVWSSDIDLPTGLSGLFVNHPSIEMAVLVRSRDHPVRRRFSAAHEYAHALFDRGETAMVTRGENSSEPVEVRANAFAATFLMPGEGVAEWLAQNHKGQSGHRSHAVLDATTDSPIRVGVRLRRTSQAITCQDVAMIACHFGVSYTAAVWRLRNLRHVSDGEAEALMSRKEIGATHLKMVGRDGFSDGKPRPLGSALTEQLVYLAVEAFRQGLITQGRLGNIGRDIGVEGPALFRVAFGARPDYERPRA